MPLGWILTTFQAEIVPRLSWVVRPFCRSADIAWQGPPGQPRLTPALECKRFFAELESREMGVSWICMIVIFWHWLFVWRTQTLLISRNADAVDKVL